METIKTSGADLENKRIIFGEIGLIIALLLVFFAFGLKTQERSSKISDNVKLTNIAEEMIPITVQETKPPPPPATKTLTIINIVNNEFEVENDINIDAEADQETVIEEYIPYVPEMEEEETVSEEVVFVIVESMPYFLGGMGELKAYLRNSIIYPSVAKELGIEGKVFVSFVVEKDGAVSDVVVLRGIGGGCDEESIRVVEQMPKWVPGKQRNMPVRVRFNLPIKFTLQ